MADNLVIDSVVELQLNAAAWPVFDIAASAIVYPFQYSSDKFIDLGALAIRQYPDPSGRLRDWARTFVLGHSTDRVLTIYAFNLGRDHECAMVQMNQKAVHSPALHGSSERR